jgi:bacteriocin biosynthesis cyclodehydratase domain-containing protein
MDSDLERPFTKNPLVTLVHCGDDEVVVKHGSRSRFTKTIRDGGRTKLLGRILRHVVPPVTLAELARRRVLTEAELGDSARLVDYLRRQEVLVDPGADLAQVYFDTVLGRGRRLAERRLAVAGAGPLGSRIAAGLARLGVGRLEVQDDRRVEDEAVDRGLFAYAPESVRAGRSFLDGLGDQLGSLGHAGYAPLAAPLDDEAAVSELAGRGEFLVVALEEFSSRLLHLANSVALARGTPWLSVYLDGSEAVVGPLYVPGETCCYNEFEIQHEATLGPAKDEYLLYKETTNGHRPGGGRFALPPYLDVAAGLAVVAVAHFLLQGRSYLVGRANRVDFERMSIDFEEVLRLPRCPACSPARPGYRHLFM